MSDDVEKKSFENKEENVRVHCSKATSIPMRRSQACASCPETRDPTLTWVVTGLFAPELAIVEVTGSMMEEGSGPMDEIACFPT